MASELEVIEPIDLTKFQVKPESWTKTDFILLLTTGGAGFLAKEAFKYFFPALPSLAEQVEALEKLIKVTAATGAKRLKVRMSAQANASLALPKVVKDAKVVANRDETVDLEITFA